MTADISDNEDLAEHFGFLDALRESGATNMFGAGAYLEEEFEMTRAEARAVLQAWMKTFDRETPPEERAAAAIAEATGGQP